MSPTVSPSPSSAAEPSGSVFTPLPSKAEEMNSRATDANSAILLSSGMSALMRKPK